MCNTTQKPCQTGLKLNEAKNEILELRQRLQQLTDKQIKINDLVLGYLKTKEAPHHTLDKIKEAILNN